MWLYFCLKTLIWLGILHAFCMLCFTHRSLLSAEVSDRRLRLKTAFNYQRFTSLTILYHPFQNCGRLAQGLRCMRIMEVTQGQPNLFSEKQAATRRGVARITYSAPAKPDAFGSFVSAFACSTAISSSQPSYRVAKSMGASSGNTKRQTRRFPASSASCGVREPIR